MPAFTGDRDSDVKLINCLDNEFVVVSLCVLLTVYIVYWHSAWRVLPHTCAAIFDLSVFEVRMCWNCESQAASSTQTTLPQPYRKCESDEGYIVWKEEKMRPNCIRASHWKREVTFRCICAPKNAKWNSSKDTDWQSLLFHYESKAKWIARSSPLCEYATSFPVLWFWLFWIEELIEHNNEHNHSFIFMISNTI